MATDHSSSKPFSPDEIQKILHHLQQPAVFTGMTANWPALQWTAEHLRGCLGHKPIRFRLGRKEERNGENQTPISRGWCEIIQLQYTLFSVQSALFLWFLIDCNSAQTPSVSVLPPHLVFTKQIIIGCIVSKVHAATR